MMLKIREARTRKKLTLEEVAKRLGTYAGTISKYERGEIDISFRTLQQIATALDVPISELYEDEKATA